DLKDRSQCPGSSASLPYQLAERPNLSNHITPLDGVDPNRSARNGGLPDLCSSRLECQQSRDDVSDCDKSTLHVHLPQATIANDVWAFGQFTCPYSRQSEKWWGLGRFHRVSAHL